MLIKENVNNIMWELEKWVLTQNQEIKNYYFKNGWMIEDGLNNSKEEFLNLNKVVKELIKDLKNYVENKEGENEI